MTDRPAGEDFPVQQLEPSGECADLALAASSREAIDEIAAWLGGETAAGSWALLRGPNAATSEVAALLGRDAGRSVYRIDLSAIISKYIGETEKNLDDFLGEVESTRAVLLLDAESLDARPSPANDRARNQKIAYLLQRLEGYRGVVLLATNPGSDLDEELRTRCRTIVDLSSEQ